MPMATVARLTPACRSPQVGTLHRVIGSGALRESARLSKWAALRSVLVGMYRKQLEKSAVDAALDPLQLPEGVRASSAH